jgi:radical SAM protein with 4Fe4S-binding SPASM domain
MYGLSIYLGLPRMKTRKSGASYYLGNASPKRKVKPFYLPPSLFFRQIVAMLTFASFTGWSLRKIQFWLHNSVKLLRSAAGTRQMCCFGVNPHVVWEATARCNLRCIHCHAGGGKALEDELSTEEAKNLLDDLSQIPEFRTFVFAGGEPLVREDLFELIAYAKKLGFNVFGATNGTLITPEVAKKLRKYDVGLVIGLDATDARAHNRIRGVPGAYERVIEGIENSLAENLYVHLNLVASKINFSYVPKILAYGDKIGAVSDFVYRFMCSGRGEYIADKAELSPPEFKNLIETIYQSQGRVRSIIVPVATPEYWAYLLYRNNIAAGPLLRAAEYSFGGCVAGKGMIYIKPQGDVWPCPFLEIPLGNVKKNSLLEIWNNSQVLRELRNRNNLKGECGKCVYKEVCGGCRATAYFHTKDYLQTDLNCPLARYKEKSVLAHSELG